MAHMRLLVILRPNHKKAWRPAPAEQRLLTAPCQAGRTRQKWAVPSSGANGTCHQGAAGPHR